MVYYIVTRDCVPSALLRKWRPSASGMGNRPSTLDKGPDIEDGSFDDAGSDVEVSSPLSGTVPFPSTQPASSSALAVGHHRDESEDEEVISISGKNSICISKSIV